MPPISVLGVGEEVRGRGTKPTYGKGVRWETGPIVFTHSQLDVPFTMLGERVPVYVLSLV